MYSSAVANSCPSSSRKSDGYHCENSLVKKNTCVSVSKFFIFFFCCAILIPLRDSLDWPITNLFCVLRAGLNAAPMCPHSLKLRGASQERGDANPCPDDANGARRAGHAWRQEGRHWGIMTSLATAAKVLHAGFCPSVSFSTQNVLLRISLSQILTGSRAAPRGRVE